MIGLKTKAYRKKWQEEHKHRMRMHKLKWYYRNREIFYGMRSRPIGSMPDSTDLYYLERNPEG